MQRVIDGFPVALRAAQAEQRRKDAEFVEKNYVGGSKIADAILAQEDHEK